jgi:hypothetical protein
MKEETRNIETFKVGAGAKLNEFDFHKHQGQMHEQHGKEIKQSLARSETTDERVARLTKAAHEKVLRKRKRR